MMFCQMLNELKKVITVVIEYYNYWCYPRELGNVKSKYIYKGGHFEITKRIKEAQEGCYSQEWTWTIIVNNADRYRSNTTP